MEISGTLFVSIASYRDAELVPTLRDLLRHAAHPQRLHIAICQQDCLTEDIFLAAGFTPHGSRRVGEHEVLIYDHRGARIEVISVHYYLSRGAGWARHLAETLFADEDYFLQIDSHCRFIPGWDKEMIALLRQLQQASARPILTAYPPSYQPGDDEEASKKNYASRQIFSACSPEGLPTFISTPVNADAPVRGSYLAAGFVFTIGEFVKAVPNDPHIFFVGEEIAMAVRAFTHGYDIYHPHRPLLWHYYQRNDSVKVWTDHNNSAKEEGKIAQAWWERDRISKQRVRLLLGIEDGDVATLAPWTAGSARTLRQFEFQAGISLRHGTVLPEVSGSDKINFFPTPPEDEAAWLRRQSAWHKGSVVLRKNDYALSADDYLHIGIYTADNALLFQRKIDATELGGLFATSELSLPVSFSSPRGVSPSAVRICCWSASSGWGNVEERKW